METIIDNYMTMNNEEIKVDFDQLKYGAIYCYNIISWNIKHCPVTSVMIDDIRCFDMKDDNRGTVSARYVKNTLIFSLNIFSNCQYREIKNIRKYSSITLETFTTHFIDFYNNVSEFINLKQVQHCYDCFKLTYQLTFKNLCNECHIFNITKRRGCNTCIETKVHPDTTSSKQSKIKTVFMKFIYAFHRD